MRARLAATTLCVLTGLACGGRATTPVAANPAERLEAPPSRRAAAEIPGGDSGTTAAPGTPAAGRGRAPRPHAGSPTANVGVHHTLRQGQTLYSLARTYGIPLAALMSANGITDPASIPAGTDIFIPGAREPLAYRPAASMREGRDRPHDGDGGDDGDSAEAITGATVASMIGVGAGPAGFAPDADGERPSDGEDGSAGGDARRGADARPAAGARDAHGDSADDGAHPAVRRETGDRLLWPLNGVITGPYGKRGRHGHHAGIDIDGQRGDAILAAGPGVVVRAGVDGPYGRRVEIDHGDGIMTLYAHADRLLVHEGQRVRAGQPIARVGRTGNARGTHLHFEVRRDGATVNPLPYLDDAGLLASSPR